MPPVDACAITETNVMKDILLIQNHRRNDLLQTTPALTALRRSHPEMRISVLVRKQASEALRGNPDLDEVIAWHTDALLVNPEDGTAQLAGAKADLREFIHTLRARKFDTIYNFSDDLPSALLTYLLNPRKVAGLTFCKDNRYRVRNEWLRYLFLATEVRHLNTLNLSDIFVEACEGVEEVTPRIATDHDDEQFAEEAITAAFNGHARPVALYLPPSEQIRAWSIDQFGRLAAALQQKGAAIVLLGADAEREKAAQIGAQLPFPERILNLAGAATVSQTAALLKRSLYLVASDPTAPQIAAATHTPCLVISTGPYCAWDLGPYGDGHYVMEPADACFPCDAGDRCSGAPCRDGISVEAALAAIRCMQSSADRVSPLLRESALVFSRSTWMPDGMLGLRPLNRPELTPAALLRAMLRACMLTCNLPVARPVSDSAWRPWGKEFFSWYRLPDSRALLDRMDLAKREFDTLNQIAESGMEACRGIFHQRILDERSVGATEGMVTLISDLERRVLERENLDAAGFLVVAFRHALRDTDELPLAQSVAVRRALYQNLARSCRFMSRALDEFTRKSGALEDD